MSTHRCLLQPLAHVACVAALFIGPAHASQLVYVPLDQPCRLLDTRTSTGGSGPLVANNAIGPYLFGTADADIESAFQHGSATGCGLPTSIVAVSVNMNILDATGAGNIATWSADTGPTAPNIGTGVYNPSVASPAPGQVLYNTGYTTIPLGNAAGSNPGKFYLKVANGQIDMTINVVGYWLPLPAGTSNQTLRYNASNTLTTNNFLQAFSDGGLVAGGALGTGSIPASGAGTRLMWYPAKAALRAGNVDGSQWDDTNIGAYSTAMGFNTIASGGYSVAMGYQTTALGDYSTAMGRYSAADGVYSTALGASIAGGSHSTAVGASTASGDYSTAMGGSVTASGSYSTAIGKNVDTNSMTGSFIYGDASSRSIVSNTANNQFVAAATGGVYFFTSCAATCTSGVGLAPGSGTWSTFSDRNAKTAMRSVNPRDVLNKVAALPLSTWQYKSQDSKYRHMGPMAQDFYAAFELGESDRGIDTVDADGVALAAIQGLNALLAEKDAKITALETEVAAEKQELAEQRVRVAALSSLANELADVKAEMAVLRRSTPSMVTVASKQP